ncbi:MFS transporter [Actinoplanes sp. TFC3]|uniref:MFS transporter n=1 Tax=Actinoplanes sp. TFC3 TaxID=1710355 RepID=UPI00082C81CC|nr:MFS transporter [Actinoplanes sp. TFC3]
MLSSLTTSLPRVRSLLLASVLARAHLTALPVSLTFLLPGWAGSYTAVGVVSALLGVGQAIAGPVRGRIADRGSAGKVLTVTGLGYGAGLAGLVLVTLLPGRLWPLALPISFAAGLLSPPTSQIARAIWARVGDEKARRTLYAMDATGNQLVSILGPLVAASIVAVTGGATATATCAVLAVAGALGFALVIRRAGVDRVGLPDRVTAGRQRSLLRSPAFVRALFVPFFLIVAQFAVTLSVVAWAAQRGTPGLAGVLEAVFGVGSLAGGVLLIRRAGRSGRGLTIAAMAAGLGLTALLLPPAQTSTPVWLLAAVLALTGTAAAPSFALGFARIGDVAPPARRAEAFGWVAAATTGGVGLALPVIGQLMDHIGPSGAVAAGAAGALAAFLLTLSLAAYPSDSPAVAAPAAAGKDDT